MRPSTFASFISVFEGALGYLLLGRFHRSDGVDVRAGHVVDQCGCSESVAASTHSLILDLTCPERVVDHLHANPTNVELVGWEAGLFDWGRQEHLLLLEYHPISVHHGVFLHRKGDEPGVGLEFIAHTLWIGSLDVFLVVLLHHLAIGDHWFYGLWFCVGDVDAKGSWEQGEEE